MALSKFLNPKNDVAFRRTFGTEKNKDILVHFLNDILGFTGKNEIRDRVLQHSRENEQTSIWSLVTRNFVNNLR